MGSSFSISFSTAEFKIQKTAFDPPGMFSRISNLKSDNERVTILEEILVLQSHFLI